MAADFVFAPTPRLAQGAGRRIFSLRRDKKIAVFFVWSSLGQLAPGFLVTWSWMASPVDRASQPLARLRGLNIFQFSLHSPRTRTAWLRKLCTYLLIFDALASSCCRCGGLSAFFEVFLQGWHGWHASEVDLARIREHCFNFDTEYTRFLQWHRGLYRLTPLRLGAVDLTGNENKKFEGVIVFRSHY